MTAGTTREIAGMAGHALRPQEAAFHLGGFLQEMNVGEAEEQQGNGGEQV